MESIKSDINSDLSSEDFSEKEDFLYENRDILHDLKMYYRLCRKVFKTYLREKTNRTNTNVLLLSSDCPDYVAGSYRPDSPLYYINEMRKQYPNTEIRLMLPIIGLEEGTKSTKKIFLEINGCHIVSEKTPVHFEFFIKNKNYECVLYKIHTADSNITVYGLWSQAFSYIKEQTDLNKFENITTYLRAARIAIRKINKSIFPIDIIHSDKIPFFCGMEFESKFPAHIKVMQTIDDFAFQDNQKQDAFYSLINIADKKVMKKVFKDSYIQTCISDLFSISPVNFSHNMNDYLDVILKNYSSFISYSTSGTKLKGEIVFNNLNKRIIKMFPILFAKGSTHFYPLLNTIKKADMWTALSKSYHNTVITDNQMPQEFVQIVTNSYSKSSYILPKMKIPEFSGTTHRLVYNNYDINNFRNERKVNKDILLKEFSNDRIQTTFYDRNIFQSYEVKIEGYLDSFYDAPLLFSDLDNNLFGCGADILFDVLLKMFEINRNIQVIISMRDGLNVNYIKSMISFLKEHTEFNGRWVFVDSKFNLPKILSAADMILLPHRENFATLEHLIAMNYGCVPIAAKYGYLDDTVNDLFENISDCNGFKTKTSMWTEDSSQQYFKTLDKAMDIYKNNPSGWNVIVKNALNTKTEYDFKDLEKYYRIYQKLLYI